VIAVYDGERYIGAAIDSVLGQSFRDFELLVVDDGSTDRTAEIVRERRDPRLRVISNERNLGLSRSLNRGLCEARGELVARLDADDLCVPDRLRRQVAFMDANPDVALAGSWYVEMAADGAIGARRQLPTDHWDLRWQLCFYCPFVHSAVLWRRRTIADEVGQYDERLTYSMDYDLWRRIAQRCRVANLPEYLVLLRVHAASMTATYGDRVREGLRMQGVHAARLLGWPEHDQLRNEERIRQLYDLVMGTPRGRTPAELIADAKEVLRLHDAFVASEGPPRAQARRQRLVLRRQLAVRLLRASRTATASGRRGPSAELLRVAIGLAPGALLSRDGIGAGLRFAARGWPSS
jgi:hypothetical protein